MRRSSHLIDYGPTDKPGKKGFSGYFVHEGRHIWHAESTFGGARVLLFLDDALRATEERDYLERAEKHPDTHSVEAFHERQSRMGTIAMLTNLADKAPEQVYKSYKGRAEIEKVSINGQWVNSEAIKSTKTLIAKLGVPIT